MQMKKQYIHLCVYPCNTCEGPVVNGSVAVRENEISEETDLREVGAICLSCGHRQSEAGETAFTHYFPPLEWEPIIAFNPAAIARHTELTRVPRE
jgi:hypothetical protein